jgi:hypothetical protein
VAEFPLKSLRVLDTCTAGNTHGDSDPAQAFPGSRPGNFDMTFDLRCVVRLRASDQSIQSGVIPGTSRHLVNTRCTQGHAAHSVAHLDSSCRTVSCDCATAPECGNQAQSRTWSSRCAGTRGGGDGGSQQSRHRASMRLQRHQLSLVVSVAYASENCVCHLNFRALLCHTYCRPSPFGSDELALVRHNGRAGGHR